jgi:glycosyltransferase involved in cell wall biosynthesis
MIQFWKVRGKTVIAIFDDAYDIMHPQNVSYPFWNAGQVKVQKEDGKIETLQMNPKPLEQFKWGLRMVKGIQVPSEYLAKDWSKYNQTYYVHNFLNMEKYMNIKPLLPHDQLTIGWCGSLSHHSSFTDSGVLHALKRVVKHYPNVRILIGGDKRVYELLETENKYFQNFVPREQWTALLKSLDIGLAPLSGEYDKRRSWIKGLEYMALKIPWIGSNFPTYKDIKEYGKITENGVTNWFEAISEVIENYSSYKERAETVAYDFALEQDSAKKVQEVTIPLYKKLIEMPYP